MLTAAFEAGYYESPRETTGQELAEQLDVTPPTLRGHLREAERTLLSLVFAATDASAVTADRKGRRA